MPCTQRFSDCLFDCLGKSRVEVSGFHLQKEQDLLVGVLWSPLADRNVIFDLRELVQNTV